MDKKGPKKVKGYSIGERNGNLWIRAVAYNKGQQVRASSTYRPDPAKTVTENLEQAELIGQALIAELRVMIEEKNNDKGISFGEFYRERFLFVARPPYLAPKTYEFYESTINKHFFGYI